MSEKNKAILAAANAAVTAGDNEDFLAFCTEETKWTFVGDKTRKGKAAVRQWMTTEYTSKPWSRMKPGATARPADEACPWPVPRE